MQNKVGEVGWGPAQRRESDLQFSVLCLGFYVIEKQPHTDSTILRNKLAKSILCEGREDGNLLAS